jgi:rod shape-determining protein MreB
MTLRPIMSIFSSDLAIDLGTANTLVYADGQGIVVDEPSVVAMNRDTGEVEAVGTEAKEMLGRTPLNVCAIRPMREGVIADFNTTQKMLTHFIRKAHRRNRWVHPRIVMAVPSEMTHVEKRAVVEAAARANASEVHLVEQPMAAALGADMPVNEPAGNMIVDIGGGTTEIAVLSLSGVVYARSLRIAGNSMDEAIQQHVRKHHNLLIGERTAEGVKIAIGSAAPLASMMSADVKGRDVVGGLPRTVNLTDAEVRSALEDSVGAIIRAIRIALEATPPELSADISDRGIVLTGGTSLLRRLDERITNETGLPVSVANNPLSCVALGTGKILGDFRLVRRMSLN